MDEEIGGEEEHAAKVYAKSGAAVVPEGESVGKGIGWIREAWSVTAGQASRVRENRNQKMEEPRSEEPRWLRIRKSPALKARAGASKATEPRRTPTCLQISER